MSLYVYKYNGFTLACPKYASSMHNKVSYLGQCMSLKYQVIVLGQCMGHLLTMLVGRMRSTCYYV